MSCTYFVHKIVMSVPTLYTSCMYKMYTKYVSCIQNVQKYVQNTYRLDVMVAVFLLAKPPPSTTQNGMILSYNHHNIYEKYVFQYTTCIQNIVVNVQNVYKISQRCTNNVCIMYKFCI